MSKTPSKPLASPILKPNEGRETAIVFDTHSRIAAEFWREPTRAFETGVAGTGPVIAVGDFRGVGAVPKATLDDGVTERVEVVPSKRHVENQVIILATALIEQMEEGGYRPLFVDVYDDDHERRIVNQGIFEITDEQTQILFDAVLPSIINAEVGYPYFIVKLKIGGQVHAFGINEETGQIGHL